ncbi:BppU family phage baseplate upper protein, partial [Enterococcus durans]|uniref:BppU family phage baseplate upper protein n=1 Tax=Enterococcus durans TaxID=53345 RepID=UPI001C0276E9
MVYKTNESIIVIQAEATNPNRTNVVFWSHDRGTAKLRMKLVRKNGIPQSLPEGTTVPIRLMFKSATAEGGYGKHDYLATVEDPVNGIVSIVLEDNILGYVGTVEGSVYIDFPNDRSLDTAGRFTFYIKRSPIDDSTPELEDYYFNGFSQTIDKIEKILADGKQEIDQKIAESETQIDAKLKDTNDKITKANQDVATLNTNIDKANDRIDQTNQQIGDLGKLKKMYSNSTDFGDYDYSGNPNLLSNVTNDSWTAEGAMKVTAADDYLELVKDTTGRYGNATIYNIPGLRSNSQYTTSLEFYLESGTSAEDLKKCNIAIEATNTSGQVYYSLIYMSDIPKMDEWVNLTSTFTTNTYTDNLTNWKFKVYVDPNVSVSMRIRNSIKIEKGSTATPYQPNLLDAPYYLSKVPLGKNISDPAVQFPIKSSAY